MLSAFSRTSPLASTTTNNSNSGLITKGPPSTPTSPPSYHKLSNHAQQSAQASSPFGQTSISPGIPGGGGLLSATGSNMPVTTPSNSNPKSSTSVGANSNSSNGLLNKDDKETATIFTTTTTTTSTKRKQEGEINNAVDTSRREIHRPVVFQCQQCRTIVADSTDLVDRRADLRWAIFSKQHGNVRVVQEWLFSNDSISYGCLYNPLHCLKCDLLIGVCFHTTNAAIEDLRGKYVLFTSTLLVYELNFDDDELERQLKETLGNFFGDPIINKGDKEGGMTQEEEGKLSSLSSSSSSSLTVLKLQQEIGKLQKFCLCLHDRCNQLERQLLQRNSNAPLKNGDDPLLLLSSRNKENIPNRSIANSSGNNDQVLSLITPGAAATSNVAPTTTMTMTAMSLSPMSPSTHNRRGRPPKHPKF